MDGFASEDKIESVYAKKGRLVIRRIMDLESQLQVIKEEDSNDESESDHQSKKIPKKRGKKRLVRRVRKVRRVKKGGKKGKK